MFSRCRGGAPCSAVFLMDAGELTRRSRQVGISTPSGKLMKEWHTNACSCTRTKIVPAQLYLRQSAGALLLIAFAFGRTRMSLNWCCVLISFRSFCLALYHMLSQVRAPRRKLRRATPRLPCLCCRRPQHCHGAWLSRRRIDCRCRACTIMRHSSRSQPRHWAASRLAQRSSRLPPSTFSQGTTAGS